jgi:Icc-related predicted phosphoesterase
VTSFELLLWLQNSPRQPLSDAKTARNFQQNRYRYTLVKLNIISDLHLDFVPGYQLEPIREADLTIVPGDLGHSPDILERLADWPTPVIFVPGNHEYDQQDYDDADEELRDVAAALGLTFLNCDSIEIDGVRFLGTTRWADFDLLGEDKRESCMRAGDAYLRHMGTTRNGRLFGAEAVRQVGLAQRAWIEAELAKPFAGKTVVITHFGPSKKSADPRYGLARGTASFCNNDDDLVERSDLWIHGHLHCAHDYFIGTTRVICNPRGYENRREHLGFRERLIVEI